MARNNLTRGLIRLWIAATVAWLAVVAFLSWDEVSIVTRGRWQYAAEMLEGGDPWKAYDGSKPFAEVFAMPSKAKWPASFSKVENQYLQGFEKSVTEGALTLVGFSDASELYVYTGYPKVEQELVSRWFWERRWGRRWDALLQQSWLPWMALGPPLALLLIGLVVRWIWRGFRPA